MKTREKPKYSIWQNLCFSVKLAWQTRKRVLLVCVVMAVIGVLLNLAELYIAPEILAKVETHASLTELLLTIGGFTAALFLLNGLESYLDTSRQPAEIDVRKSIIRLIARKTCETSYPNIRDPKVLRLKEQASSATSSNSAASEHIWRTLTELLKNLIGFAIYLMLLTNLNGVLILVVILTSAVGFFVTRYINEWEVRHREEKEVCVKEINYFQQRSYALDFAKDLRIFGLGTWLCELQNKAIRTCTAFVTLTSKWPVGKITMETQITDGKINLKGNFVFREKPKRADYILYLNANNPIAIVEAKDNKQSISHGLQQAMAYAQMLDIPFAFSSNGDGFAEHDFLTGTEREFSLDGFQTEEELIARYKAESALMPAQETIIEQPYYSSQTTYSPRYCQGAGSSAAGHGYRYGQDLYSIPDCVSSPAKRARKSRF